MSDQARYDQLQRRIGELEHEVALLRGSTSWRMTAPVRFVCALPRRIRTAPTIPNLPQPAGDDTDRDLVMRFESLGDNCEFGLMQRKVGRERLSLLRYGGARSTTRLTHAIRNDLAGFGTEQDLDMYVLGTEWIAVSLSTGFSFHTGRHVDGEPAERVRVAESTKLRFMADILREDLATGHKILVRRVDEGDTTAGMEGLAQALRARGPAILLWVVRASGATPHGMIEHVGRNLFLAHHGELGLYGSATIFRDDLWIDLLRRAEVVIDAYRSRLARRPHRRVRAWLARSALADASAPGGDAEPGRI